MVDFTTRPVIRGTRGAVTAGHYLASAAGFRILEQGGNAVDSAAAMVFCLNLLEPHNCGLGGEVPLLVYSAKERKVHAISGQGSAPAEMTIDWFRRNRVDLIPGDGLLPAMVPAVVGTMAEALVRFGTMSFAQVLQPAIELAEEGFPFYPALAQAVSENASRYEQAYPATARLYLREGKALEAGDLFSNEEWAQVLRRMCLAEKRALQRTRTGGIEAACAEFYQGETASQMADFLAGATVRDATGMANKGFLTRGDLSAWKAKVEEPVSYNYRGVDVFKCPPWCQGPVFLQQLALLAGFDLKGMGHNTAEYVHTLTECAKLAFADREAHYGDPDFDNVPMEGLLSDDYSAARRNLVGPESSRELRPGDAGGKRARALESIHDISDVAADNEYARQHGHDTTHCDAVDRWGNMVSATPSGGWIQSSPVIPGLGFPLGTRGQMFYLNPNRPNALSPHKRPRTTLTPSLALRAGSPYMVFGTPGGDQQDQWTLQFFLNVTDFGMELQAALDAPTIHTNHFPSSFYPRKAQPNKLFLEGRIPETIREELAARGHEIECVADWSNGRVMGIRMLPSGVLEAAASPRGQTAYAIGW